MRWEPVMRERRAMAVIVVCVFILLSAAGTAVSAEKACRWDGGEGKDSELKCSATIFATGCVGLKNVSGRDVQFFVHGYREGWYGLKKGRAEKADFTGSIKINSCYDFHTKEHLSCHKTFNLTANRRKGGGCGSFSKFWD